MNLRLIQAFKQSPSYCGPACLKMVLHYYGKEVTEEELGVVAKTTFEDGTTNDNLLLAAQAYGLDGVWHQNGTIEELRTYAHTNVPVIIEWFSSDESPAPGEPHYSIVLDVTDIHVLLLDPEDGKQYEMSHVKFMSTWFSFSGPYIKQNSDVRLRHYLPLIAK